VREAPAQFLWAAFVTYFGNAISPFVRLTADYSEPRLYTVTIGESAKTRKSSANDLARDFFEEAFGTLGEMVIEGFGSAEGLMKILAQKPNTSTLLHLDEINILVRKTSNEKSLGMSLLHRLFEEHDYTHPLSEGTFSVKGAYLSILGASTLDDFRHTWTSEHVDAGSVSRFFLVGADAPTQRVSFPGKPDQELVQVLRLQVKDLVDKLRRESKGGAKPVELSIERPARTLWHQFYASTGQGEEWNRITTYGLRLMTIQSVLKGETSVSEETVREVIDLCYYEAAVRELAKPLVAENQYAKLELLVLRHVPKDGTPISRRELFQKTNAGRFGTELFERVLRKLVEAGDLERAAMLTPKRKKQAEGYRRILDEEPDVVECEPAATVAVVDS
jgi:hypothetical protein